MQPTYAQYYGGYRPQPYAPTQNYYQPYPTMHGRRYGRSAPPMQGLYGSMPGRGYPGSTFHEGMDPTYWDWMNRRNAFGPRRVRGLQTADQIGFNEDHPMSALLGGGQPSVYGSFDYPMQYGPNIY